MNAMPGRVLVTDVAWFRFLSELPALDEVNFWRPSDTRTPRSLLPGMPVLFKLKKEHGDAIVGQAAFARHKVMSAELAWDCFGERNGAASREALFESIERLRRRGDLAPEAPGNYEIGCLMLAEPVFLPRESWVRPPAHWPENAVQGKSYDLSEGEGARVWREVMAASADGGAYAQRPGADDNAPRYGPGVLIKPRLGQGTFRVAVLDAYGGSCAVTHEHSVPALEAAHIRPFASDGPRDVTNGLLLRSDLHRLFDKGYVGIDADYRFQVSDRLKRDYSNGRSYYPLSGGLIRLPSEVRERPDRELLQWHMRHVFRE
jgi:putative restriction endonuclease